MPANHSMANETPPKPSATDDAIRLVVEAQMPVGGEELLRTLAPPQAVDETIYLSTPITTGPKLLEWLAKYSSGGSDSQNLRGEVVREAVVRENIARLVPLRERVRSDHPDAYLIDPTSLEVDGWKQRDYHRFWVQTIRDYVDCIVFADGWTLSTGCVIEYAAGLELGIPMLDSSGVPIDPAAAASMLRDASDLLEAASRDSSVMVACQRRAEDFSETFLKDAHLAVLAESYNVARFVSFTPGTPAIRFGVLQEKPIRRSIGMERAVELLLSMSRSHLVNVRTFRPDMTKGNPFYYGIASVPEVVDRVRRAAANGFYCIVNETIDIHDGGVSGVTLGGIAEFAPDDTPRVVEGNDAARLPIGMATHVLRKVYGDSLVLPAARGMRFEFSAHPTRVGQRREQVIVWEAEAVNPVEFSADVSWPNRFSELVGDKTFGLLVADAVGLPVPRTTVVNRRVAPFQFGRTTGTGEWWMRTAPARQDPGHFTTTRGWCDPFQLIAREDSEGAIASVLGQEAVDALFSGATLPKPEGQGHIVEGVIGAGDDFMLGAREPFELPKVVEEEVREVLRAIEEALSGSARIEWAVDDDRVWVLQLHRVRLGHQSGVFSPGTADTWLPFDPSDGLASLNEVVSRALRTGAGVEVTKPVGLTSHVGDVLRKAGIPGRLRPGNGDES